MQLKRIATIHTPFSEKFGIPRQSGMAEHLCRIVFEPEYRDEAALRGIEEYSHLWLIWHFSKVDENSPWRPTVRPPRLGGNKRMGVFATRSPYRPNPMGLSSVKLVGLENVPGQGITLLVEGADLMDGTPIFDIKPYLSFTDSHPDAVCGFADRVYDHRLSVNMPENTPFDEADRQKLADVLALDPRPSYQDDPERVYGMSYGEYEVKFKVDGDILTVTNIKEK